jgi:hypothetical protein
MNIRLLKMEDRGTLDLFDSLRAKEIYENTARVNLVCYHTHGHFVF